MRQAGSVLQQLQGGQDFRDVNLGMQSRYAGCNVSLVSNEVM